MGFDLMHFQILKSMNLSPLLYFLKTKKRIPIPKKRIELICRLFFFLKFLMYRKPATVSLI